MAYTYADFQSYLGPAGLKESDFSAEDLAMAKANPTAGVYLLEAKADWKNAKTDDERAMANARANQVREQYGGYDGGIDGANGNVSLTPDDLPGYTGAPTTQSSAVPTGSSDPYGAAMGVQNTYQPAYQYQAPTVQTQPYMQGYQDPYEVTQTPSSYVAPAAPDPFSYDKQAPVYQSTGEYTNKYADQQAQMLNDITNYKDFEFDAETNPQMVAYRKQYAREGNRAMQDTLGSMAGMTGGMPSTAAVSAAQQANNYYMSQLGDRLPEIYQAEYNKYLQEFNMLQDKYGAVNQAENIDYSRYWDGENFNWAKYQADRDQYNTDRNQAFNEYQSNLGQYNADRQFGYGQTMDDIAYKTNANDTAYNRAATADEIAYGRGRDSVADQNYAQEQARIANDTNYNRAAYADETAYNRDVYADETEYKRGRDAVADERYNQEWKAQQEQDAFDRQYKLTEQANNAKVTEYNNAIDRFEMMGYADAQTAKTLGVKEGAVWGGQATELALQQSKLELERTQAQINNINKDTAYIGRTTSSGSSSKGIDEARINTAFNNASSGTATGADIAILRDAGYSEDYIASLGKQTKGNDPTGGMPSDAAVNTAISKLDGGTGSASDITVLIKAGFDESDISTQYPEEYKAYKKAKQSADAAKYPNL